MSRPKGIINKNLHIWTEEEKQYLADITPGRHYKDIHEMMIKKFDYQFTFDQVIGAIKRYKFKTGFTGRYEKGNVPYNKGTKGLTGPNKGSFYKGQAPINIKPVGSERINVDGYIEVKVAEPNIWKFKQRVVWEEHYGKIPDDSVILFADKNKLNIDISNLRLVTKAQLSVLNNIGLIQDDANLTDVGINVANVIMKITELKKKK